MEIKKRAGICPVCHQRNHPLAPNQPGDVCDECFENLRHTASPILCNGCNSFAGMVAPGETPDGFKFELGQTYHVPSCKRCNPLSIKFDIVELKEYLENIGKKTDNILP